MADLAAAMDRRRLVTLLSPAYLWLLVAVFLPLSAMLFFSLLTDLPQDAPDWGLTLDNYGQFLTNPTYATLLWKSLKLGVMVTLAVPAGDPAVLVQFAGTDLFMGHRAARQWRAGAQP